MMRNQEEGGNNRFFQHVNWRNVFPPIIELLGGLLLISAEIYTLAIANRKEEQITGSLLLTGTLLMLIGRATNRIQFIAAAGDREQFRPIP